MYAIEGQWSRASRRIELQFQGLPGEVVPALLLIPTGVDDPVPCVIYLHGIGRDMLCIERIVEPFLERGFAVVSFDQLTRGLREGPGGSASWRVFGAGGP